MCTNLIQSYFKNLGREKWSMNPGRDTCRSWVLRSLSGWVVASPSWGTPTLWAWVTATSAASHTSFWVFGSPDTVTHSSSTINKTHTLFFFFLQPKKTMPSCSVFFDSIAWMETGNATCHFKASKVFPKRWK